VGERLPDDPLNSPARVDVLLTAISSGVSFLKIPPTPTYNRLRVLPEDDEIDLAGCPPFKGVSPLGEEPGRGVC